jgi:hypothetical protein
VPHCRNEVPRITSWLQRERWPLPVRLRFRNAGKVAHQALIGSQAEQDAAEARGGDGGPAGMRGEVFAT